MQRLLLIIAYLLFETQSVIVPCTELNTYAQYHTLTAYKYYYYSCGWYSWRSCTGTTSYTSYYATYYSQLDCCAGYGGTECIPICNVPCGTNKECSSPNNCACIQGWKGSNCLTDIDECVKGTDLCQYHETCVNIAGSYNCDCPHTGDKLGLDGHHCIKPVTKLRAVPHRRDIALYWDLPLNEAENGTFDIECTAEDNLNMSIPYISDSTDVWVESFVVAPVTPFTEYTCAVTPATNNGHGNPVFITVETLEDKPDGPPTDLAVNTIDSMILEITWVPPEVPNGVIEYYKLRVDYTNSTKIRKLRVDPEYNMFFLEFLNPYQNVGVSVSAKTMGGEGPATSFIYNRTLQAEPGRVHDIQVSVVSDNAAEVTWNPPKSLNGIVMSYHINLYQISEGERSSLEDWELEADEELSVKVFNLAPYVPYEFIVIAATKVGKGEIAPFKFFTAQDVPKVSPTVLSSTRTSAGEILITWTAMNADDLQGFFNDYILKYYTSAVVDDCSSPMDEKMETTTDEYILLKNLDPHSAYCVKVAAASSVGTGNYTHLIYIDMYENSKFELHFKGVHDCKTYVIEENSAKLDDVAEALTDVCNNFCKCGVQNNYFGSMRFLCDDNDNDRVIFQASIIGTPTSGSIKLVEHLDQWKNASPIIVVEGLQLHIDSTCDVPLDDFGSHTHCTSLTDVNTAEKQTGDRSGPYIAGISVVIITALVFASVVIIVAIILIRKRLRRLRSSEVVTFESTKEEDDSKDGENLYEKEEITNMD